MLSIFLSADMIPFCLFYVDDRGLHRSSTMPGVIKNDEITNETAGPSNLERSRTERRRQNNPADDPAKQLLDERIPIKKKVHISYTQIYLFLLRSLVPSVLPCRHLKYIFVCGLGIESLTVALTNV